MDFKDLSHIMFKLPSENILKTYGIRASKKLGQNFLNDFSLVEKIIQIAKPLKDELVLEVGPGLGIVTRGILKEAIQKLFCIEYDKRCLKYLQDKLLTHESKKIKILNEDALKFDQHSLLQKDQKFILISNLPYNISTMLLLKWLKEINSFKKMVLMFQKEVAERICASPNCKKYGILSVLTQFLCETKLEIEIPAQSFFPQPKVDSAVISIIPRRDLKDKLHIYKKLELLCKTVFNNRRKTLSNSISPLLKNPEKDLSSIGIDPRRRPETLLIEEFQLIVNNLF